MSRHDRSVRGFDFLKMEGAGNDFVLLDTRRVRGPRLDRARIAALLNRRYGIGGDGLLRVRPGSRGLDAQVDYWNADGGRATFCGNGARCVAKVLLDEAPASVSEVRFRLERVTVRACRAGTKSARASPAVTSATVRIAVSHPRPRTLALPATRLPGPRGIRPAFIDSGVPHWILPVAELESFDLDRYAPPIRHHEALAPAGSNVDAVELREDVLHVRTWERGVEGETEACGSGLLAAAWWAVTERGMRVPVRLRSRGGASFRVTWDGDDRLWLEGPAREAFRGRWGS